MRTCVIFNPAARGNKARHFCRHLGDLAGQSAFKATTAPGDARRLAAEAVAENFELIVAAGGDGTVNEVLNGIGDAPDGFERARLGVLPLGTVNVLARELKVPLSVKRAWKVLPQGREVKIDLGCAEFSADGVRKKQFFVQLAGAGLDARAIELVDWSHKKKIGPLAYLIAGLKALREKKPKIAVVRAARPQVSNSEETRGQDARAPISGELILIGNGKFYGGSFEIFPKADLCDGLLDVCIFPRVDFPTLLHCAPSFLTRQKLPERVVRRFRAEKFELNSETPAAFELDGEWAGNLPATFSIQRERLRVIIP